jgi:membrane protein
MATVSTAHDTPPQRRPDGSGRPAPATAQSARPAGSARPAADAQTPAAKPGGVQGKVQAVRAWLERHTLTRILLSTAEGFQKDEIPNHAAAMTYFGVFSLFPLILLFLSLAGLVLQNNQTAREEVMSMVTGLLPQGQQDLQKIVLGVIEAKGTAAGVGLVLLLWSASGWFQVIDNNVNRIWGVTKARSFIKGRLFALAMVACIGTIALGSFVATAAINFLAGYTGMIPGVARLWELGISLVSVLTIAVAFYLLYRYVPRREVKFADVWPAAVAMAVIWEATRRLLTFYFTQTDMISGYGPIGAVMALLFWIYIASIIILVGAELAYAIAKDRRHVHPTDELEVVAPPGEQPTPKFAPQLGEGFRTGQDEDEPTRPASEAAQGAPGHAASPAAAPRRDGSSAAGGGRSTGAPAAADGRSAEAPVAAGQRGGERHIEPLAAGRPAWQRALTAALAMAVGLALNAGRRAGSHGPASRAK